MLPHKIQSNPAIYIASRGSPGDVKVVWNPNYASAYYHLGQFRKAVELAPSQIDAHRALARIAMNGQRLGDSRS